MKEKRHAVKLTAAQLEAVAKVIADRIYGVGVTSELMEPLEAALYAINNARPSGLASRLAKAVKEHGEEVE